MPFRRVYIERACCFVFLVGVTIGMQQETYFAMEEIDAVTVCALLSNGTSERNVSVTLSTQDGEAEG